MILGKLERSIRASRLERLIDRRERQFQELTSAYELPVGGSNAQHIVGNALNLGKGALQLAQLPINSRSYTKRAIDHLRALRTYFALLQEDELFREREMTGSPWGLHETDEEYRKRNMAFPILYNRFGSSDKEYIEQCDRYLRGRWRRELRGAYSNESAA